MDFRYKRKYSARRGRYNGRRKLSATGMNARISSSRCLWGRSFKDAESGLVIADRSDHTPVTIAQGAAAAATAMQHFCFPHPP